MERPFSSPIFLNILRWQKHALLRSLPSPFVKQWRRSTSSFTPGHKEKKTWWKVSIWFRPMGTRNPWTINPESLPLRSVWFLENSDFIRFQACPKAKTTWSHFEIPQKIGVAIFISLTWYILNLPPTQDASSKWRFDREFLKKYKKSKSYCWWQPELR